ncbi:MAG: hypothetical protein IJ668_03820 [Selenomonadaceae bacterium]|nr:hypothetical protein [Selenomonadaceae bacterium]
MDENLQSETSVRWAVTDPLGKKIMLYDFTFENHIVSDHESKDAANRAAIEAHAQYSIANPRFIIRDRKYEGRRKYLDLVDVPENVEDKIRSFTIIVDENDAVVTWIPKRSLNEGATKGEKIYDARMAAQTRL